MKKVLFCIGLGVLIVLGVFVFLRSDEPAPSPEVVEHIQVDGVGLPAGVKPFSGVDSLRALAQKNESLECQIIFERNEAEGDIEGTYFTHNGKLRGDFMVPAPEFGGAIVSSMIVDLNMLFVWTLIDGETLGFKTDLTAQASTIPTKEPVALDAPVKYTCTTWQEVDGSIFIPPAAVTFTDTAVSVEAGMEYGSVSQ